MDSAQTAAMEEHRELCTVFPDPTQGLAVSGHLTPKFDQLVAEHKARLIER
jgi:hypothetical protein